MSDFVEINRKKKKKSAETMSRCFHYLMHLQSAKWTGRGEKKHLRRNDNHRICILAWRRLRKHLKARATVFSLIWYHQYEYRRPSSLHTAPRDPNHAPCSCVSPFSRLIYPSPLFLCWLLLTLVWPNQPFMLEQSRKLKKTPHIYSVLLLEKTPHTQLQSVIRSENDEMNHRWKITRVAHHHDPTVALLLGGWRKMLGFF